MKLRSRVCQLRQGWTLVELIGVLAVIALLAGFLLPVLIRQVDKAVADQEVASLRSFHDALQQYVLTTRVIPDQTTWYSAIAAKLGFGTNNVLYNVRQQSHLSSRVFLIDPALQMGLGSTPTGLPYSQTNFYVGSSSSPTPMLPVSPRLMIVSSLGKALPNTVASGTFGNTTTQPYFADLWNTADGTVPSDAAWSGWTGNPGDVIVQRINLSPLFVHLVMGKYNSATYGYYTIDGVDGTTVPTGATNVDGYFIQGTVLTLYTNSYVTNLDAKMILTADTSLVFELGVWRGALTGASTGEGAANAGDVVQQFLEATSNTNAQYWSLSNQNTQQVLVVNDMLTYVSNYNYWVYTNNFSKSAAIYTTLKNFEPTMMDHLRGLYSLKNNNYPTNPFACLPP